MVENMNSGTAGHRKAMSVAEIVAPPRFESE
jgi:hypothetical protein